MKHVLLEALKDTSQMIPLLLGIYCFVEWTERRFGHAIQERIQHAAKAGPLLGSSFGCVPQCGFSVLVTAMYTRRLVTVGTLLAVYLSTADEAVPVILSQPKEAWRVVPLILTKFFVGLIGGYVVDIALGSYRKKTVEPHDHVEDMDEKGCCEHHIPGSGRKWGFLWHPLIHTAKVFLFILGVTLVLNYAMWRVGDRNLGRLLFQGSAFQPILTAFIGLIPNCGISVAIAQLFLKHGISFGSAIAGLSASGGLGMLVLLKENHNFKDTIKIIGLLLAISSSVGMIIQHFMH